MNSLGYLEGRTILHLHLLWKKSGLSEVILMFRERTENWSRELVSCLVLEI